MSYSVYRFLTHALWPVAVAAATVRTAAGRPEWKERVGRLPETGRGATWLHAASVGEVAAVVPLARALSERRDGVFVTVVTPTGRASASRSLAGVPVSFAPLDFVPAVRRVIGARSPRALLLTETDVWPNTVYEAAAAGIPVGMVNGRLSERSLRRYTAPGSPMRVPASRLSFAACRSEEDAGRYRALGLPGSRVAVVGDTKFDKLAAPLDDGERESLRGSLGITPDAPVVVFGSVRPREEAGVAAAAAAVLARHEDAHVVVAPRHLARVEPIVGALEAGGMRSRLRSAGGDARARVTVVDTTGELASLYAVGAVAFVGGTLAPYGGHDPLEPAAQGVPVLLGRHTETCRDTAGRLTSAGAAVEVGGAAELTDTLLELLADRAAREEASAAALRVVSDGRGATVRTVDFLESLGVLDAR